MMGVMSTYGVVYVTQVRCAIRFQDIMPPVSAYILLSQALDGRQ
jgi:hypothetical protein